MTIRSEASPSGSTVVYLAGSVDQASAPALRDELHALVKNGSADLVVDLTGVEMIDSTALGALISGLKAARKNGGDLRISNPGPRVSTLLKLTNLDHVLKLADSFDNVTP